MAKLLNGNISDCLFCEQNVLSFKDLNWNWKQKQKSPHSQQRDCKSKKKIKEMLDYAIWKKLLKKNTPIEKLQIKSLQYLTQCSGLLRAT